MAIWPPNARAIKQQVKAPVFVAGPHQPAADRRANHRPRATPISAARSAPPSVIPSSPTRRAAGAARTFAPASPATRPASVTGRGSSAFPAFNGPRPGASGFMPSARPPRARKISLWSAGGPAGLKAAAVAAERGHRVTLFERERHLGGQALLAQALPGRAEIRRHRHQPGPGMHLGGRRGQNRRPGHG